jgi:Ran GTPase-activating protein (RanGAP) involved in mRNA processing and transport
MNSNTEGQNKCDVADALKVIASALNGNLKSLQTLDWSWKDIRKADCLAIGKDLEKNKIRNLYLSGNQFGDAGCIALAKWLKENTNLLKLYLGACNIGDAGCKALAEALKGNESLCTLYLSGNEIGDAGCIALADALEENESLHNLDLSMNYFGVAGRKAFAAGLANVNNLQLTELEGIYLSDHLDILGLSDVANDYKSKSNTVILTKLRERKQDNITPSSQGMFVKSSGDNKKR